MQSRTMALMSRPQDQSLSLVDEDRLRENIIARDQQCQRHILLSMQNYRIALSLQSKHVYQALPRLLSLWCELTAIRGDTASATNDAAISSSKRQPTFGSRGNNSSGPLSGGKI